MRINLIGPTPYPLHRRPPLFVTWPGFGQTRFGLWLAAQLSWWDVT